MAVEFELPVVERFARPATVRRRRAEHLRRRLVAADVLAALLAGSVASVLAQGSGADGAMLTLALVAGWPVAGFACGLYARDDLRSWASGVQDAPRLVLTALAISWPLLGLLVLLHVGNAITGALSATMIVGLLSSLTRASARLAIHRAPRLHQRTLVVGSGDVAQRLVDRVGHHPELGLEPIGYIDEENGGELDLPRLGDLASLPGLISDGGVDRVMIAFSRAHHEQLLEALRVCRNAGVAVDVVPRLFEFLDGARTIDQIGGLPLLSIDIPSFSRLSQAAKRGLDIAGSGLALLVLSPLLLGIALAIKLDSRGPVLFTQPRSGRGGRFFKLYKFRSMRVGATVEVRADGAIVKGRDDTRVTRVGRFIRRFSLDEAPQLINVLIGDMSLVGPRPLVVAEHEALTQSWHAKRADLRPGLTGPWQVAGRSNIPFHEMIGYDYQYVAGWSLARDLEILLATLPAVLSGRGAY